jgi:nicotinate phosphoribosyltransferase
VETAVFELFVRKLPVGRGFLMAAGLEQAVQLLEAMRLTPEELAWLRVSGKFSTDFLDGLENLNFTGDVDAMPEGTIFFPDEPIVRVVAPLPEVQLVETRLINLLHFQTVIASKAVRMVLAAPGKQLVDFGLRRTLAPKPGYSPPVRAIWRASLVRLRCWRPVNSIFRRSARWHIPLPSLRRPLADAWAPFLTASS